VLLPPPPQPAKPAISKHATALLKSEPAAIKNTLLLNMFGTIPEDGFHKDIVSQQLLGRSKHRFRIYPYKSS
jgi:hypothetical protein